MQPLIHAFINDKICISTGYIIQLQGEYINTDLKGRIHYIIHFSAKIIRALHGSARLDY